MQGPDLQSGRDPPHPEEAPDQGRGAAAATVDAALQLCRAGVAGSTVPVSGRQAPAQAL